MPELPEVETVRRGLAEHATGRRITSVSLGHPRAIRRVVGGPAQFRDRLTGRRFGGARRRGKFLWLPLDDGAALVAHLGMSGQFRVLERAGAPDIPPPHAGVGLHLSDGTSLWFCDQRTFGWVSVDDLDEHDRPESVAHIAADPFDAEYDLEGVVDRMRSRHTEAKRALLDQSLVSGIGNIYADEALWRARLHGRRRTEGLTRAQAVSVLDAAREVMAEALAAGGTSFDALYVNVNGDSGWFDRSLAAYGQEGQPCARCGTPIRRESFMNRSSFFCPVCQRPPRRRSTAPSRTSTRH
jgi:formamidopyrimidine-DNA glycosylase